MQKSATNKRSAVRDLTVVALSVAFITLCSYIAIPTPLGHITLQLFAILLIASVFDFKKSVCSVTLYVLMGLIGLPIFAGFRGGLGVIFEVSGGFLAAFIITSILIPTARHLFGNSTRCIIISSLCSILLSYVIAALWIHVVLGGAEHPANLPSYIILYTAVFIIPDLAKLALVAYAAPRVRKFMDFYINKDVTS